ncbi:MAG TPA: porin [Burkholderiales bacterium]|nr:porin [Burkholderiales bacterium]
MKCLLAAAGAAAALAFAGAAAAQSVWSNLYIGASAGRSDFKDACGSFGSCDAEDTALRILAGYQFNKHFAAEFGYHELGEASTSAGDTEGKAWELVAIASFPFTSNFFLYAKLGGYFGQLEGPFADEDNTDLTYGVGLRYDFTRNWGVRGEWQRYSNLGGGKLVETDVDVLSIGFVYSFR